MSDNGTTELDPALRELEIYHGREFSRHSLREEISMTPVDDVKPCDKEEVDRLEDQHQIFKLVLQDRNDPLFLAPITNPDKVLDCGHGSASWALEVAEAYPDCQVVGVDISPHMNPDDIPENLYLQVANLNDPFSFPSNYFDLVNSRLVAAGISAARWPRYMRDIKAVLKPGGWVQMVELYTQFQSDSGMLQSNSALRRWSEGYNRSLDQTSRPQGRKDRHAPKQLDTMMMAAGFVDVQLSIKNVPMSPWPTDPHDRRIGRLNHENSKKLLRSLGLYTMTNRQGMSIQEFDQLVDEAVEELDQSQLKPYMALYICFARKP